MMNESSSFYFQNYAEWHHALTQQCKIKLTPEYAQQRISALTDLSNADTKEFTEKYGDAYRQQVVHWFKQSI